VTDMSLMLRHTGCSDGHDEGESRAGTAKIRTRSDVVRDDGERGGR
jgi:hypothetical protein